MIECFYIPGLNNYGDDLVHIGPLTFFRMHEVLEQHLSREGVQLTPLYPPRARLPKKTEALAQKLKNEYQIILLGHSTGGILARALSYDSKLQNKIKGIITFGCPHHGSHLAAGTERFVKSSSLRKALLQKIGYDTESFLSFIGDLSPESLNEFNKKYPENPKIPSYSIVCGMASSDLPFVFKLLYLYSGHMPTVLTDGMVAVDSQRFGKVVGNFKLDHLNQIGFFKHLVNPIYKKQTLAEFDRFIKTISSTIKQIAKQN